MVGGGRYILAGSEFLANVGGSWWVVVDIFWLVVDGGGYILDGGGWWCVVVDCDGWWVA